MGTNFSHAVKNSLGITENLQSNLNHSARKKALADTTASYSIKIRSIVRIYFKFEFGIFLLLSISHLSCISKLQITDGIRKLPLILIFMPSTLSIKTGIAERQSRLIYFLFFGSSRFAELFYNYSCYRIFVRIEFHKLFSDNRFSLEAIDPEILVFGEFARQLLKLGY